MLLLSAVSGLALAQPDSVPGSATGSADESVPPAVERPSGANREVRMFDFEEGTYNPLPVPAGWVRAQDDPAVPRVREGFPIWNQATLDTDAPAYRGGASLRMPIAGGSTSLLLQPGVIGVFPGADYMVDAWVRTENLIHARACVSARLLDERGQPLPGTRAFSARVRTMGEWSRVSAIVPGLDERAAYLQIELLVLQPKSAIREVTGEEPYDRPFAVWREDFNGMVWFDDVAVTLLPRIELTTDRPGQVFPADDPPDVSILVRDLTGEFLGGTLRTYDADGIVVDAQRLRQASGRITQSIQPVLPGPGWYRAVLDVESNGEVVGRGELLLAWGAAEDDERLGREATRAAFGGGAFGLSADAWLPHEARALPEMARWSGARRVTVGVWHDGMSRSESGPGTNHAFSAARMLLDAGIEVAMRIGEVPIELARLAGRDAWDVTGVLGEDESIWMPWAEQMLDRYGQGVISWQAGDRPGIIDPGKLDEDLSYTDSILARWVPGPELRVPRAELDPIDAFMVRPGRGLVLRDSGGGSDHVLSERVRDWADAASGADTGARSARTPPTLTIELESAPDAVASRGEVARTARRALNAWARAHELGVSDRVSFALREPWRASTGLRPEMMPAPELVCWRTLSSVLGEVVSVEPVDLIPGVRSFVCERAEDTGVLIAWLEDPGAPAREIRLPLANGPVTRVGMLGDRSVIELEQAHREDASSHTLALNREPVLVEGIDADYVSLLASVRFTPGGLEPRMGVRRHELVIDNPFDAPVQGKAFIVEPGGYSRGLESRDRTWDITPRVVPFVVPAGGSASLPIDLSFGASQVSGWVPAVIDIELAGDGGYPPARLRRWLALESDEVQLEVTAARRGRDLIVHAFVTNLGVEPRSVDLMTFVPGSARERSAVRGILPGATAERRYVIRNARPDASVSVALSEPDGPLRLLEKVEVP